MLYSWEKFGLEKAQSEYYEKYCLDQEPEVQDFKSVVLGKISFLCHVRKDFKPSSNGKPDVSIRFLLRYFDIILGDGVVPVIRTEGYSDILHLLSAWRVLKQDPEFKDMQFEFFQIKSDLCYGNRKLISLCEKAKIFRAYKRKVVCIFDCDDKNINDKHKDQPIRDWGSNVFSFVLPRPEGLPDKGISIEFLYNNKQITTIDKAGRRLFFSDEFNKDGKHKKDPNIIFGKNPKSGKELHGWHKIITGERKIIDYGVYYGPNAKSIALSKTAFARYIFRRENGFDNPDFSQFKMIFAIIKKAITTIQTEASSF
jgi:hypothetical protein